MDLNAPASRRDLAATRADLTGELRTLRHDVADFRAEFDGFRKDLDRRFSELEHRFETHVADLHRHFDVVAESFKTEFKNLFDWTQATTTGAGTHVDDVEREHERRIGKLETRVTRLERREK